MGRRIRIIVQWGGFAVGTLGIAQGSDCTHSKVAVAIRSASLRAAVSLDASDLALAAIAPRVLVFTIGGQLYEAQNFSNAADAVKEVTFARALRLAELRAPLAIIAPANFAARLSTSLASPPQSPTTWVVRASTDSLSLTQFLASRHAGCLSWMQSMANRPTQWQGLSPTERQEFWDVFRRIPNLALDRYTEQAPADLTEMRTAFRRFDSVQQARVVTRVLREFVGTDQMTELFEQMLLRSVLSDHPLFDGESFRVNDSLNIQSASLVGGNAWLNRSTPLLELGGLQLSVRGLAMELPVRRSILRNRELPPDTAVRFLRSILQDAAQVERSDGVVRSSLSTRDVTTAIERYQLHRENRNF